MLDHPWPVVRRGCRLLLAVVACLAPCRAVAHSDAVTEFEQVLLREAAAREAASPNIQSLRAIAGSYELIARRYPTSAFADIALWRAVGVLRLAYARYGLTVDHTNAAARLARLRRDYPTSPLARRAPPPVEAPRTSREDTNLITVTASAAPASPPRPAATPPVPPVPPNSSAPGGGPVLAPAAGGAIERDYSLARQLGLRVSRVVVDPGHGGHDPGAQANGLTEASLVLDVALRLETLLREEGIDVVLTRRTSAFVPLEERLAIANRAQADLLLSIHANASPLAGTSGIETYVLNFATDPQAEALAARENATGARPLSTLPTLLAAIALNSKVAESRALAHLVQSAVVRSVSSQPRPVKSLGVKQAPFLMLIGAQMPSILVEIGFLTNRSDAAMLEQSAGRDDITQGLFDAVLQYQDALQAPPAVDAADEDQR